MSLLLDILAATGGKFPTYFVAVYVVGLIAAVSIGLVAFFNSKRPVGWEEATRPEIIPDLSLKKPQTPEDTSATSKENTAKD